MKYLLLLACWLSVSAYYNQDNKPKTQIILLQPTSAKSKKRKIKKAKPGICVIKRKKKKYKTFATKRQCKHHGGRFFSRK